MQQQAFRNAASCLAGVAFVVVAGFAALPASAAKITMVFPGPVTTF